MVPLLLHEIEAQKGRVLITKIPYQSIGHNLFISHKACSLVLVYLSQYVFVCSNFVVRQL